MKQIKGLSDIIILCLYPESDCWNSIFLAILLSCLLQHLNLVLFVQHVPWWFTEPKILLWDAKIKLSWLCFTFVENQLVVPVLISKWWTNWGSRARYVTHQRKSAKLAGNHALLQVLGHKKRFCWHLHRLLKLLGVPQGNRAINIPTFNFRHKKDPWNLNMAPKRKKFGHQEDPCWDFTFNLPGCSEQICHVPSGDQPADAPCPPAPCPSPPWPGDEGCEAEIPRSWWV